MDKSVPLPSQTSLAPYHRPRKDGRLGICGPEPKTSDQVLSRADASTDCAKRAQDAKLSAILARTIYYYHILTAYY